MMEYVVRYTCPAAGYPRFKYFKDRLLRLVPRFSRTLGTASLSSSVFEGEERLEVIMQSSKCFEEQVYVTVCSATPVLLDIFQGQFVQNPDHVDIGDVKAEPVVWSDFTKEGDEFSQYQPHVIVYIKQSEEMESTVSRLSTLSEEHKRNCIIYDNTTKTNHLYTHLSKGDLTHSNLNLNQSLSKIIQHLLEAKVIHLVEAVNTYIQQFFPKVGMEVKRSMLDDINKKVKKSFHWNIWTLIDVMPPGILDQLDSHTEPESVEEDSDCDGATPSKKPKNVPLPFTQTENGKEVFTKYTDYLARKTKCHICDYCSKKYGLSSSVVNAFLIEKTFGYECKFTRLLKDVSFDHWEKLEPVCIKDIGKFFSGECAKNLASLIPETEKHIKEKMEVINVLQKMQFEINNIIRKTNVNINTTEKNQLPAIPKLPPDLQAKILENEVINGCGTIYGKLTLHTNKDLTPSDKEEITKLLRKYKYRYSYNVEQVEKNIEHAGCSIASGNGIRAKLLSSVPDKSCKYGTLGCYVRMKQSFNDAQKAAKLFGITCGHCVQHCEKEIEARSGPSFINFATFENNFVVQDGQKIDIAAIEIKPEKVSNCNVKLKQKCGLKDSKYSSLYKEEIDSSLDGESVYKVGAESDVTVGTIMSSDYQKRLIEECNIFNENVNVLIEDEPSSEPVKFSQEGDSGSVVCLVDTEDGHTQALSLLQGETLATDQETNKKTRFYYTCVLEKCLGELGVKVDRVFELACEGPPTTVSQGVENIQLNIQ